MTIEDTARKLANALEGMAWADDGKYMQHAVPELIAALKAHGDERYKQGMRQGMRHSLEVCEGFAQSQTLDDTSLIVGQAVRDLMQAIETLLPETKGEM